MDWFTPLLVVLAGVGCGFVNTLAGSGSLITLPLLIFIGLPATVANGTNRVGVVVQNLVAAGSFRRQGLLTAGDAWARTLPAVLGALLGARLAVDLDEETMRRAIGALLLAMLVVLLIRPERWLKGNPEKAARRPGLLQWLLFFAIGIYGGFIQAGVGLFLIAGLVLGAGLDLMRATAVKILIVLIQTVAALGVFVLHEQVWWGTGLLLAAGNALGGWWAARLALQRGATFVHWTLVAVVAVSAAQLLGLLRMGT